ncbi:MAG: RND multidrug efflux transporter; Acriflavin resistance protein [uncultured Rubrobacteraceae bacterium]|uniref:RND multidrug efflux transporter Acriflavin resistance protein n=1 Tax=uncultured Rubrobacteraceae bacterium TaxID=349277 RepID=A0A6J4QJ65_9ACTN|nr:MAG: RND multidrug efflux transporter; Acriflavin resistance protein [uncultured Rubrobacteraceae bacterium]
MSRVVSWCLKNKSVVFLATLLLIGSGVFATTRLNQELLPDVDFPVILVSTPVPGAGPDVVDEQVGQPIEGAISGVEGVESVQTTSSQGFSVVAIEFGLDVDTEEAETEVQAALENVTLPPQAVEPEVIRQSASEFPILNVSLAAENGDLAELTTYTRDEVIPRLEDVEGIGRVELVGGAEDRIRVYLDPDALEENNLPAAAVVGTISGATANAPVGTVQVEGLSTPVRVASELENAEVLEELPVSISAAAGPPPGAASGGRAGGGARPGAAGGSTGGGAPAALAGGASSGAPGGAASQPVLLGDIAEVREAEAEISGISRTNGEPSLGLNITKEQDANTVEVAEGVEEQLEEVRDELGEDQVFVVFNSAEDVEESVSGIVQEGLIGAVLAIVIIFAFLRSLRATLVTAVSLPTSVLAALLFSWGYDLTLNIITLAGLTIAVGRVVDDAIVVLENSYRYVQAGYDPEEAALKGTTEVASAITSSTLTTTAVFLPLGLVGGIISKFFVPLSLTVALALLASLIVSVTIIPVLVSVFIKRSSARNYPVEEKPGGEQREIAEKSVPAYQRKRRAGGPVSVFARRASTWEDQPAEEASGGGYVDSAPSGSEGGRGWGLWLIAGVGVFLIGVLGGVAGIVVAALTGVVDADLGSAGGTSVPILVVVLLAATLILGLAALLGRAARRGTQGTTDRGESEEDGFLVQLYTPALLWSLRHRLAVMLLALLVFAGGLVTAFFLPVNFFPPGEERLLLVDVELERGIGLEQASEDLRPFEDFLGEDPGVESYQVSIGGRDNLSPDAHIRANDQAQTFVTVAEDASVPNTLERIGEEGRDLYGEDDFQAQVVQNGPPQGALEVTITGGTEEELEGASEQITDELSGIDGLTNLESDVTGGAPEVAVEVDPESAAAAGVSPAQISGSLATLIGEGSQVIIGETPVEVGVPTEDVDSLEEVGGLPIGPGVTVEDVADVQEEEAPSAVSRVDGDRAVTVTGRITAQDTSAVSTEAQELIDGLELPGDVTATAGGESEDIEESFYNLFFSIIVALVLVYLLLVVFFGSLAIPLVILLAVPLTTAGAFGTLLLTNTSLSLPSLLGILLLIGIVVSNAILLVDFATKASERHEDAEGAIIEAGRARLRPILMTALATIFALLPLALGFAGGGSQLISSSLALTVIGGLATSTFLTLLVVPVGYSLLKDGRRRRKKKKYAGQG